jgi:hypothetical protein
MASELVSYAPRSFEQLEAFCQKITRSGLVPAAYRGKPDDAMVAIMHGAEHGVSPLAALQHIALVNGKPSFYGDALPGIALGKGYITDLDTKWTGTEGTDEWTAVCTVTKANGKTLSRSFSVAEAKKAGLWTKSGPWSQYPKRMLGWRAIGYAVRDAAPSAMLGYTVEEERDIASDAHRGPEQAKDVTPGLSPHEAVEQAQEAVAGIVEFDLVDEFGEHNGTFLTAKDWLTRYGQLKREAGANACYVARANLSVLRDLAITAKNGIKTRLDAEIEAAEAVTGEPSDALEDELEMEAAE